MDLAVDRYDELESSYISDAADGSTIHAYVSAIDFQLRFVMMCAAATLRGTDPDQVEMSRSSGFGTHQAFLHRAASLLRHSEHADSAAVVALVDAVLGAVREFDGKDQQFGTLVKLRNHLFHGLPLPSGKAQARLRDRVQSVARDASAAIRGFLSGATVEVRPDESELNAVDFVWVNGRLPLWPFICMDNGGRLCVFSSFNSMSPMYIRSSQQDVSLRGRGDELILALNRSMVPMAKDKSFPYFVGDIRLDLEGFRDPDHPIHHYEMDGAVTMIWGRALSSGIENRSDRFRIGDGEQRQWLDPVKGKWRPYPDFLRHIVNWPVAAARFRQYLEGIEEELLTGEREGLAWSKEASVYVEPSLRVSGLHKTEGSSTSMGFRQLQDEIDARLGQRGSKTRIYFIEGEAGIGKTRSLVVAALARAKAIEHEGDNLPSQDRLPLLYYVRSTGQASNSLDTVINAAATRTKNLELENIKALCRNGMVALVVDGFDELLGGVGYDNALGSLQQWIESMGGRGVIVVSARSSYYLNQYSASIRKNREKLDILVEHRVATFQEWNDAQVADFLKQHGVNPTKRDELSPDDRKLLGLPFFARVYAESADSFDHNSETLPDLLLNQYISRESPKLVDGQNRPLLDTEQLRRTFEGLAMVMAEQGAREADLNDLERAALAATGQRDISLVPGLRDRLSTLCALKVSTQTTVDVRFAFQHELFYDIFLADAILRELSADVDRVLTTMAKVQWRAATVSRVLRKGGEDVELLLMAKLTDLPDLQSAQVAAFRINLGSLWAGRIQQLGSSVEAHIEHATFGTLNLENVTIARTDFVDCEFENLHLPPSGYRDLNLIGCEVGTLWVDGKGTPLKGVASLKATKFAQVVMHGTSFVEKSHEVQQALYELGAPVPKVETPEQGSEFKEAIDYFLDNISHRIDSIVVYERTMKPAEDNPRWQYAYGADTWVNFIRILKDSGCAKLVPLAAGGRPVQRVRIHSLDRLRRRVIDDQDSPVAEFWRSVDRRASA